MSRDLEERATRQFQKHDALRILFFFDPDGGEREAVDNWNHEEIRCVEAAEDLFGLKYRLERELSGEKVPVRPPPEAQRLERQSAGRPLGRQPGAPD